MKMQQTASLRSQFSFSFRVDPKTQLRKPTRTLRACPVSAMSSSDLDSRLGVHALVFSGSWSEADCRKAIGGAQRTGYSFIEIPLLDPSTIDAAMTKAVLAEYGMRASGSLGLNLQADISSPDNECAQRGEALLLQALDRIHQFGGKYMCGVIYSAIAKYTEPLSPQGRKNCVEALRRVANAASDKGITLGLEVVNRYESNVLNNAHQGMELLHDINAPNVMIHLDTFHMNIEEASYAAAIKTAGDKLGYLHIGESHRGYLGSGTIDFVEVFRAAADVGFTGPVVFESFSSKVVHPDLSRNLCVWRDLWDDSDDLARQAREYILSGMIAAEKQAQLARQG